MGRMMVLATFVIGAAACGDARPSVTAPSRPVGVTPAPVGSPSMKGTVADSAYRAVVGARVEVLDGPDAGKTTISDVRGEFSFVGTFDDQTRFRATADGYQSAERPLQPICTQCNPQRWVHFYLDGLAPPVNMAGDYTVVFDSACASLPPEMRTRTYQATVGPAPYGPTFSIPLRGATFVSGWDSLPMGVAGDYVAFWLEILAEQVAPNAYLTFNALAAARVGAATQQTLTFPLDGTIDYCVTAAATDPYDACFRNALGLHVRCTSGSLTLTRR